MAVSQKQADFIYTYFIIIFILNKISFGSYHIVPQGAADRGLLYGSSSAPRAGHEKTRMTRR